MTKFLNKQNFILLYLTIITGLYAIFLTPSKIEGLFQLNQLHAVIVHYSSVFLFFFLIPAFILKYYFKDNLTDYGLNFNNFRAGLKIIAILLPILLIGLYFSAKDPAFIKEYPLAKSIKTSIHLFIIIQLFYLLYYVGWEFLFRGFTIFGLMNLKKYPLLIPIVIQTMASTLLHYTKPNGEIFLAIVGGFVFGFLVYKYKTIWFTIVLHWIVGIFLDLFIIIRN